MPGAILQCVLGNVALAAALAVAAHVAGRRKRAALAHAAWVLVLLKLVTPPLVVIPVQFLPCGALAADPTDAAPGGRGASLGPTRQPSRPGAGPVVTSADVDTPPAGDSHSGAGRRRATADLSAGVVFRWDALLLTAWAAGSAAWLTVTVRRVRRFARLLRFAAPPPPGVEEDVAELAAQMRLRDAPRVRVLPGAIPPFVWSLGRATVYFPAGLFGRTSPEGRLTLVAHELAHLRRGDHVVRWLEAAALAVYWWCPLAWLARRELRRLEEEACDAEVVAALPGSAHAYASAVLETIDFLAGTVRTPALATAIGDARSLRDRLVMILDGPPPARPAAFTRLGFAAVALALLAVGTRAERMAASAPPTPVRVAHSGAVAQALAAPTTELVYGPIGFLPAPTRGVRPGEPGACSAAALSRDGRKLAFACGREVVVQDAVSGRLLYTLAGHSDEVNAVAFSPDGNQLASTGNDCVAKVWDARDGREVQTLAGHDRWVQAVSYSPDGRTLATGGYDRSVRLWDVASGEQRAVLSGHGGGLRAVAFSPDGRTVASAGADGEVRVWDAECGAVLRVLRGHGACVRAVAFSADGKHMATASEDRTLRVWDPAGGRETVPAVALPDAGTALRYAQCDRSLLAGTAAGHLLNVDPVCGRLRQFVGAEPGGAAGQRAHAGAVAALLAPATGEALFSVCRDGSVRAWRSAGVPGVPQAEYRAEACVTAIALSADGRALAAGRQDGTIRLWDAGTAVETRTFFGHHGGVTALRFAGAARLVSAGADERIRIWDLASGRASRTIVEASADPRVALSPDGCTLAVAGGARPGITLWDAEAGEEIRHFGGHAGPPSALAFAPGGDLLAAGYADGMIRLWDPVSGAEVRRGTGGCGRVDALAFRFDAATVAAVLNRLPGPDAGPGPGSEVVFWDVHTAAAEEGAPLLVHPAPVTDVTFTPDGGRVVTAGRDGNLYLWDRGSGRLVGTIRAHADAVCGLALDPGGVAAFSAGDRSARRWPMTPTGGFAAPSGDREGPR